MRLRPVVCELLFLILTGSLALEAHARNDLKELYRNRQYFELRDELQNRRDDRSDELLFYRAVVSNKFNQSNDSIIYFQRFLNKAGKNVDVDMVEDSLEMLADNYLKTYQYRKAATTYRQLLRRFRDQLDAKKKSDIENSIKLWSALKNVPPQTANIRTSSTVKKDKEGNYPLSINNQQVAFILDTGANLSVITNSLAGKLRLTKFDAAIDVVAVAGNVVKAKLAVAREVKIGNATIRNAVFLVFDDKDLYVSEANFQIHGLIGFPVIEALRQVVFLRAGELSIPIVRGKAAEQNLCLDGLTPLIAGVYQGERLIFAFDTGASRSTLFPPFFKKYEEDVTRRYEKYTERVRGVGGHKEITGYLAKDVTITFAGKQAHYPQIPILTELTTDSSEHFYGNLGQDLVRQFEKMTLNFETMSLAFE